jgi:CRP-like cAMP-binding protein
MGTEELAVMLDRTSWGLQFSYEEIEIIATYMGLNSFSPGEYIFREGDKENFIAFIIQGEVQICKESADKLESVVVSLKAGTHFGEMSLVDEEPRSASARAKDEVNLLILSKPNFDCLIENKPEIGIKILRNIARLLSKRLRQTTGKLIYIRP